jgi:hypothetical protein
MSISLRMPGAEVPVLLAAVIGSVQLLLLFALVMQNRPAAVAADQRHVMLHAHVLVRLAAPAIRRAIASVAHGFTSLIDMSG